METHDPCRTPMQCHNSPVSMRVFQHTRADILFSKVLFLNQFRIILTSIFFHSERETRLEFGKGPGDRLQRTHVASFCLKDFPMHQAIIDCLKTISMQLSYETLGMVLQSHRLIFAETRIGLH